MTLEEIVNKLNEGIEVMDVIIISDSIAKLIEGEYITRNEARYLFQDIMNDRCKFPLSSFEN